MMIQSVAYHHVHCSGWHDWLQTFDIAHGAVELFCVSLHVQSIKHGLNQHSRTAIMSTRIGN